MIPNITLTRRAVRCKVRRSKSRSRPSYRWHPGMDYNSIIANVCRSSNLIPNLAISP